jgi:hypothetical protein
MCYRRLFVCLSELNVLVDDGGDGYLGKRCGLRARGCDMLTGLLSCCEV